MQKLLMIMLLGLLAVSCNEDTEDPMDEKISFQKSQGQCGETWGTTFLDYEEGEAIEEATEFLDSIGISANGLRVDSLNQLAVCVTCHDCPSGWYYILEADPMDEQALLDLQFSRR